MDPAVPKWVQKLGIAMHIEKKIPRISGYSVPNVPEQKSAFQET